VYVLIEDSGHLPLLDLSDFTDGEHDETVHIGLASQPMDCSATSVAGGRTEYCDRILLGALRQEVLEQVTQQLQSHVLERKGRTMKQL